MWHELCVHTCQVCSENAILNFMLNTTFSFFPFLSTKTTFVRIVIKMDEDLYYDTIEMYVDICVRIDVQ